MSAPTATRTRAPFQATLDIDRIGDDPDRRCAAIASIAIGQGLRPQDYLYRGVSGPDSVRLLLLYGRNRLSESVMFAMAMSYYDGEPSFDGYAAEAFGHTPLNYATERKGQLGAVAIYNAAFMQHDEGMLDIWAPRPGVSFEQALVGVILVTNDQRA